MKCLAFHITLLVKVENHPGRVIKRFGIEKLHKPNFINSFHGDSQFSFFKRQNY